MHLDVLYSPRMRQTAPPQRSGLKGNARQRSVTVRDRGGWEQGARGQAVLALSAGHRALHSSFPTETSVWASGSWG